jgi:hypothetical protein
MSVRWMIMRKLIFGIIFLTCMCQMAGAADLFYTGAIDIDTIHADVDIRDTASVTITYTLSNRGAETEQVDVEFWDSSKQLSTGNVIIQDPLRLEPGEEKTVSIKYTADLTGDEPKLFSLDPTLLFDGTYHPRKTGEIVISVVMPEGVKNIISTNREFRSKRISDDGRLGYEWRSIDAYPTTLTLKWTSLAANLKITKSVSSQSITEQNRDLQVDISVHNEGDTEVVNLSLSDNFIPSDFEAIEPMSEFSIPDLNMSDPRLFWGTNLGTISPGEIRTTSYSVRYIAPLSQSFDLILSPATGYMDGTMVAISNPVTVSLEAPTPAAAGETAEPASALSPFVAVFAFIMTIIVISLLRRTKM